MAYGFWHWRNSAREARFFMFDMRASLFLVLAMVHLRLWTLGLAIVGALFFAILERFGLTFPAAMRRLRVILIGNKRPAWVKSSRTKMIDYGE